MGRNMTAVLKSSSRRKSWFSRCSRLTASSSRLGRPSCKGIPETGFNKHQSKMPAGWFSRCSRLIAPSSRLGLPSFVALRHFLLDAVYFKRSSLCPADPLSTVVSYELCDTLPTHPAVVPHDLRMAYIPAVLQCFQESRMALPTHCAMPCLPCYLPTCTSSMALPCADRQLRSC